MLPPVGLGHEAASPLAVREIARALVGEACKRRRQHGLANHVADRRYETLGHPLLSRGLVSAETLVRGAHLAIQKGVHREAVRCGLYRRSEILRPGPAAVARRRGGHAGHGARHADALARGRADAGRSRHRTRGRRVQRVIEFGVEIEEFPGFRPVDQSAHAARERRHLRLDDVLQRNGRQHRVDRVTAILQHLENDARDLRVRRRRHRTFRIGDGLGALLGPLGVRGRRQHGKAGQRGDGQMGGCVSHGWRPLDGGGDSGSAVNVIRRRFRSGTALPGSGSSSADPRP